MQIVRKAKPGATVPLQQFGKKIFVDRHFAAIQRSEFILIVIDDNDVVAEVGKAGPCDQSNVSRTDNCNLHHPPEAVDPTPPKLKVDVVPRAFVSCRRPAPKW
jgi:hypothetical protein